MHLSEMIGSLHLRNPTKLKRPCFLWEIVRAFGNSLVRFSILPKYSMIDCYMSSDLWSGLSLSLKLTKLLSVLMTFFN
jgi:hypothetical protein